MRYFKHRRAWKREAGVDVVHAIDIFSFGGLQMEGLKIGGVTILSASDDFVDVRVPISGQRIKATAGGNDLLAYAKVPFGSATIQVTAWKDGSADARAAVKVANKVAPKTLLVKVSK